MCCVMGYTGHDLSAEKFKEYLLRTVDRGPDDQRVVEGPFGLMGFGRLAIMGLTPEGMQPFYRGADCVVCNGELYGFRFEKEILKRRGYKFCSDCDCEILLPLYYEYGLDMFRHMDAEFALILYDSRKDRLIAARDPIGIRPLFYGYSKSSHKIAFSSEMRNLIGWGVPMNYVPLLSKDHEQYVGFRSFGERIFDVLSSFKEDVYICRGTMGNSFFEYNLAAAIIKSSVFGEFRLGTPASAWTLVISNAILICFTVAAAIWIFAKNIRPTLLRSWFLLLWLTVMGSYVAFAFAYPHDCSMDFRYIVPSLGVGLVTVAEYLRSGKCTPVKIAVTAVAAVFCVGAFATYAL